MDRLTTDVVVLGAGTAGLNARKEVERSGRSWLLVDPGPLGTTCARVGCMPSKLLVAAGETAARARAADLFGVRTQVSVDGPAVLARVRSERDRFVGGVLREIEALPADRLIRGRARFVDVTSVVVDDRLRIDARAVVVATGSRPVVPEVLQPVGRRVLLSDDVFDLDDLPASLCVVGAGAIGLELGQALHRLGVEVVILDATPAVLGLRDPVVAAHAADTFAEELTLHLGATLTAAEPIADGVRVRWTAADGTEHARDVAYVLAAVGRTPNVDDLGLEALGVPLGPDGVPAFDACTMQVGDLPVFFAGDASAFRPVLHEASSEGRVAGANAAGWPVLTHAHRHTPLTIAFTDPQLATVGKSWDALDPDRTVVGEARLDDQGRARIAGRARGILRVYAHRVSTELLGATLFGPEMEHLGHLLAWSLEGRLTVEQALDRPFYHPVLEEALRTALVDAARKLRVLSRCSPEAFAEGPGR